MDQASSQTSIPKSNQTASGRRQRILSGMRPTGKLHLGNYVGALANWVKLQDRYDCYFFIADWHALTTDYADTSRIKQNCIEVMLDYLAAGLDPEKCTMFIQSHVPQHAELHLLLSMITPLGWLERVPTYKEQQQNITEKDLTTYGFLGYPVLQSADIMIYQADFVPVGEDQVPHIEITREIARRFNSLYSNYPAPGQFGWTTEVFPEPQPLLTPSPKLPGIDGRKMSKSYGNSILIGEPAESIRRKLQVMVNDPARYERGKPGNPDICPVGDLHKVFSSPETVQKVQIGCRSASIGCIECKSWAADSIVRTLQPLQERRRHYEANQEKAWKIFEKGAETARTVAEATMEQVRSAMKMSKQFENFSAITVDQFRDVSNVSLRLPSEWWELAARERGDRIRQAWRSELPTEIQLTPTDVHRVYTNQRNRRVVLTTSREKQGGVWRFYPRDRTYEVVVFLCWLANYALEDFVLPQRLFQPIWKLFKRKDRFVELVVRKSQNEFFLEVPQAEDIPLSQFRSNYDVLR